MKDPLAVILSEARCLRVLSHALSCMEQPLYVDQGGNQMIDSHLLEVPQEEIHEDMHLNFTVECRTLIENYKNRNW